MAERDVGRRMGMAILVVLTAITFLNDLDRYVLSAVLEPLSTELAVGDDAAGFLGTAFMVVYMVAASLAGQLGDRISRHKIAVGGVALWSLATMGSGLCDDYTSLLVMRAGGGYRRGRLRDRGARGDRRSFRTERAGPQAGR